MCIRSFIHVYDTITAFDIVLHCGKFGDIYNIGCNNSDMELSVLDIAYILIKEIKKNKWLLKMDWTYWR